MLQVSILDTGEVCMELLKNVHGQERVKEVLRISCDGSMVSLLFCLSLTFLLWKCFGDWDIKISLNCTLQITIYQPNDGKGFLVLDCPPATPENILICSYDDLPGM